MRILIDECVDPRVKLLFGDLEVATVHEQGWDALEDGPLLTAAQRDFDVLVTIDSGIEHQQNLAKFQIGVVVVHVPKNQLPHYRPLQRELLSAVERVRPGQAIHVRIPRAEHP
jgi:predicted nuclease of predicted toxin-antitoxin system